MKNARIAWYMFFVQTKDQNNIRCIPRSYVSRLDKKIHYIEGDLLDGHFPGLQVGYYDCTPVNLKESRLSARSPMTLASQDIINRRWLFNLLRAGLFW